MTPTHPVTPNHPVTANHPVTTATLTPAFTEITARRLGPVRRFFVRRPVAMDLVVMGWFGVPALLTVLLTPPRGSWGEPSVEMVGGALAVLAGVAALFWRRRRPLLVAAVVGALLVGCLALTGSLTGFDLAVALVVYAVAASRPPRVAWLTLAALLLTAALAVWVWEAPDGALATAAQGPTVTVGSESVPTDLRFASITSLVIFGLGAIAVGISVRNRRLHVAELVARGNALARERDQQARLARAAERTRIAREMHDVVAHSLTVMIALADGAGAALERSPARSRAALDELSETGRTALADMRRVLGVLDEGAPADPQPGSPDLDELVERFRTAGLPVRTTGLSTPLPADAGLQLTVYRVVQESLTNVLRHAPGTRGVDLMLRRTPHEVEVEVRDQGPALPVPAGDGAGRGLIGMRERAGVYGGTVVAEPWRDGWRVHVRLPWEEDA